MGIVAARPHQIGRRKSAIRPRTVKTIQKILRSTHSIVGQLLPACSDHGHYRQGDGVFSLRQAHDHPNLAWLNAKVKLLVVVSC
jgi:hypothetical protein